MATSTISERILEELFPDFTKQLVSAWTRGHVDDLATEVFDAISDGAVHQRGPR